MKTLLSLAFAGSVTVFAGGVKAAASTQQQRQAVLLDTDASKALFGLIERTGFEPMETKLNLVTGRAQAQRFYLDLLTCTKPTGSEAFCDIPSRFRGHIERLHTSSRPGDGQLAKDLWTFMSAAGRRTNALKSERGERHMMFGVSCVGPTKSVDPSTGESRETDTSCGYEVQVDADN